MEEFIDELTLLIKSGYSLLYILSHEERRVERIIGKILEDIGKKRLFWTETGGFRNEHGTFFPETSSPMSALRFIENFDEKTGFFLKDFHFFMDQPLIIRKLKDLIPTLEDKGKTIFFLSSVLRIPYELEKDFCIIDFPLPDINEIAKILSHFLKTHNIEILRDQFEKMVKASLGLTEEEIKRVYSKIVLGGGHFSSDDITKVITEKKKIIRKSEFVEFFDTSETIQDVGGHQQLKEWLINRAKAFTEKAREYGLPQPKGLFLVGIQGCGKSLIAKVVANLWKVPLLRLDISALFGMGSSSTEENLRHTIRIAESMAPVVLWIDEIEKGFAGGIEGINPEESVNARIFASFLTWLQEKKKPVFVVATANNIHILPPELLRKGRFDEIFFVDLPDLYDRKAIFSIHLRKVGRNPNNFDIEKLAIESERFSGAEIEQAIISALFNSFSQNRELRTEDIIRCLRETIPIAITMEEKIKELRNWAKGKTRSASYDRRRVDFFLKEEG